MFVMHVVNHAHGCMRPEQQNVTENMRSSKKISQPTHLSVCDGGWYRPCGRLRFRHFLNTSSAVLSHLLQTNVQRWWGVHVTTAVPSKE